MESEKSIISKLMHRCNPLKTKNEDYLVEAESLLFAANTAIDNLFDQSSCGYLTKMQRCLSIS